MRPLIVILMFALTACGGLSGEDAALAHWQSEDHVGGVSFVGDSITARWPAKYLPDGAYNRGIDGATTADVLRWLWVVLEEEPDEIYLMIGVNSLYAGVEPETVAADIESIALQAVAANPGVQVHVLGILPTKLNLEKIDQTNALIESVVAKYRFVDYTGLRELFYNGEVINTLDGAHPTEEGYRLIYNKLLTYRTAFGSMSLPTNETGEFIFPYGRYSMAPVFRA